MKISNLNELFLDLIEDVYDAEHRLVKALPKMAEASSSVELRAAFEDHLQQTKDHFNRLEQVFSHAGSKPKSKTCDAMKGLISETEHIISATERSPLRDAGLIAATNRIEHYEIAAYGSARAFAQTLGLDATVSLLERTLEEEKAADQKLTTLAEQVINQGALHAHA